MKQFILVSNLFFFVSCRPTFKIVEQPTEYSTVIEIGGVTGVVFKENADCFLLLQGKERFTPTIDDIQKAERILKENLEKANSSRMNQVDNCPVIHKKLKSYRRQYFGYIDNRGDKVIYATFNWDRYSIYDRIRGYYKEESENWKKEKEVVMDGCSYHWEIKINLNTEQLFELEVNGIASNERKTNANTAISLSRENGCQEPCLPAGRVFALNPALVTVDWKVLRIENLRSQTSASLM